MRLRNDGTAIPMRTAAIEMVTSNSIKVNPESRNLLTVFAPTNVSIIWPSNFALPATRDRTGTTDSLGAGLINGQIPTSAVATRLTPNCLRCNDVCWGSPGGVGRRNGDGVVV